MDGWMDGRTDVWMNGWTDILMNDWTDRWIFICIYILQTLMERLQATWINLQVNVNGFMDSDINKKIKDAPNGIKQV